ncbi:hypothetical protein MLD38_031536 [Melastoma candidum]|uniref:Uncharacterized protein n=1 Tax=Melastoma candidum TaxID=119954 RepID=A0ACB9MPZ6_9MYRT|nr:hypothetical protein MLD38_031536 [Melastoma candidum]
MAGKSNKGRGRRGPQAAGNNGEVASDASSKEGATNPLPVKADSNGLPSAPGVETAAETKPNELATSDSSSQPKQGDLHLYPMIVKTQSGEKLELQLNPGDSVMDIRQFLLDAPETCFYTCYDLLLHAKDGSTHCLEDYNEISEVTDITVGNCSLEMVAALYNDRSIRAHVHRTRDLLSLPTLHASLSTSLALQYESTQNKASDASKIEIPELDGLGVMEDVPGSLTNLLPSSLKEIKCIETIVFSSLNPPPTYRRLLGDLIYLDVVTLENNAFCITGTTRTFYVNSSTGNTLDPRPSKASAESTTLIGLLQKISPRFKKAFREVLEKKAAAHPFENVQSLLPPNSWLGSYPVPDHRRDAARAEDALTLSYGCELIGMQRDWNEELQSCRDFPHTNPHERILRDRALYKVTSDFVDAAVNGAVGVISRCIPPINPTDPECFHMYVHNNIFFSFAIDADLDLLSSKRTPVSSITNDSTSCVHESSEVASTGVLTSSGGANGTVNTKTPNIGEQESNVSVETADNEQATYASANNDLKGTKAYQEADVSGLYNLAMAIIDYRGHRVVAQSVLPGILQGDKSESLLYGSVDNGKKICWNEEFHSKVLEAAKHLHLKEHSVLDGSGNIVKLAGPVECKGIVGSDDRHYLLDLMRVTPRDANYTGPGSRFCVLRPELVTSFCQGKGSEQKKHSNADANAVAPSESNEANMGELQNPEEKSEDLQSTNHSAAQEPGSCDVLFNPNVFTDFKLAGSEEEIASDEENVRKISLYLRDVVLPKFIQDLCTLEVSPMDGQTLTEALHAHGINVRYLGKVAEGTKNLPHLWDLCSNEIVVRSAKHIFKDLLRDTEDHDLASLISHFLNCFFGDGQAPAGKVAGNSLHARSQKKDQGNHHHSGKSPRGQGRWKNRSTAKRNQLGNMNFSSDTLWSDIQEFAKLKYQFELAEDARLRVKKVAVIRNFSQKVGISIAARKYDLSAATPFLASDILDIQPVVKHSIPLCSEAKDLVELGKVQLAEGMLSEAYTLFSEAFSMLQQVTGPMHREVANCCRYLAMVLYHAGDMAGAIMQQHKELIINERCLGLDHPDTAHSYGNMALFYHGLNQTELALRHMARALLLLSLSSGPDHPDVAATFINVAMMYQDIGKMDTALRYLQEALKKNERLLGEEHIQTAVCYHALAIAFNCMGAFKLSHQHEKKTYDILVKQLGEEDSRTKDSQNWMKTFKMRELQMNAQKQKGQALNAASAQKAIDILKAHPGLIHAFQAAAVSGGTGNSGSSINQSLNSAIIGESHPRGRGMDERAARAAAEVRKKAAARGLLIRPHGVPVQALQPLTQLLNIINSGMTPDVTGEGANGVGKEVNGQNAANDSKQDKQRQASSTEDSQPPVGLGQGLSAPVARKQKGRSKAD